MKSIIWLILAFLFCLGVLLFGCRICGRRLHKQIPTHGRDLQDVINWAKQDLHYGGNATYSEIATFLVAHGLTLRSVGTDKFIVGTDPRRRRKKHR